MILGVANDVDEENCKWRIQDHLQYGIYRHEDCTVFFVASSDGSPDEYLSSWVSAVVR